MVKKWGFSQKGEIYVKKIKDLSNFNFRIRDCICGFMRLYGYNRNSKININHVMRDSVIIVIAGGSAPAIATTMPTSSQAMGASMISSALVPTASAQVSSSIWHNKNALQRKCVF